jgi:hypothetical protein
MNENDVEKALYDKLGTTSALTTLLADGSASIYNGQVLQGDSFPVVVFSFQSGTDDNKTPNRAKQFLYLIKSVTSTKLQDSGDIDAEVDTALHNSSLAISGYTNYWLMREQGVRFTELGEDGKRYYHVGGIFRIRIAQ